jgi:hypothetical protein
MSISDKLVRRLAERPKGPALARRRTMRIMMFMKAAEDSEHGSFAAAWTTGTIAAMGRFAAKLMGCAAALLAVSSAAAEPVALYPDMAPIDAYLMDRAEEIALARSAAPNSISRDATILVLTRTGYETAVTGTNGFVCMVVRGFGGPFDWPERFNPKIRSCPSPSFAPPWSSPAAPPPKPSSASRSS